MRCPSCWNALRDGNGEASEATMTGPFAEFREWLAALERFWTARVGALGGYLNEEDGR